MSGTGTFKDKLDAQRAAINASIDAGRIDPRHGRMVLAALDHTAAEIEAAGIMDDPTPEPYIPRDFFN